MEARLLTSACVQPGHEYTKGNVKFAKAVLPDDAAVQKLYDYTSKNKETQGKFTIGDEKKHNVFMRLDVSLSLSACDTITAADRDCTHRTQRCRRRRASRSPSMSWASCAR